MTSDTRSDPPRRVLIITPTDFDVMWNNVEHARIGFYTGRGWEVTVLHMRLNDSTRLAHMLRDSLTWRTTEQHKDGVRYLAVDPYFNYCAGVRVQSDARTGGGISGGGLKRLAVRLVSPLAVLRDVFWTPCYVGSALRRTSGRFDACIGVGPWASLVGRVLRRLGRVRTLVYLDRDYDPGLMPNRVRRWYTGVVERRCLRRADAAVSVGYRLHELRKKQTGVETEIIPNGIVWADYQSARDSEKSAHRIAYVGMLTPYSGIEQAIGAMQHLTSAHPDAILRVIGSGVDAYNDHLRALIDALGVGDRVEMLGSRPHAQLPELLRGCAIGLSNSRPIAYRAYACPLKVMEYMACGMAVIATEQTEAADILDRFGTGIACAFGVEPLAESLSTLLSNPEGLARMQESSRARSREVDWEVLLGRELALIEADLACKVKR